MAAKKHFLSNVDEGARTATCSHCGPTKIHRRYERWVCAPKDTPEHRRARADAVRTYRERHPEKNRESANRYARDKAARQALEPRVRSTTLCACGCGEYTFLAREVDKGVGVGKPLQYLPGHNLRNVQRPRGPRKMLRYIEDDRGYSTLCWIWQLKISRMGYGVESDQPAHRAYYTRFKGPIPEGYQVDHLCHQRACVNPAHLQAVTPGENLWRMFMGKAGLTSIQITSLRDWMTTNLRPEQIAAVWGSYDLGT